MQKNFFKKTVYLLLSLVILGTLVSCQKKGEAKVEDVSQSSKEALSPTADMHNQFVIGIGQFAEHPSLDNCREGIISSLAQKGLFVGQNLTVEYDNAQTDGATATQIYTSYVSKNVDLLVAIATPMAQAAYSVTHGEGKPIVYSAITDPIAAELADKNGNSVGMITGTSDKLPVKDQLKMIRKICPNAKKVGILYTTSEVNSISSINDFKSVASEYGFEIIDMGVSQASDIPLAVDNILGKVDCLTNVTDNTVVASLPILLEKANAKNIPVFGSEIEQVKRGCVACCGLDYFKLGMQTGDMIYKVLTGSDITKMPFETITDSDIYLNKAVLDNLKLSVDDEYLNSANTVFKEIER